MVNAGPLSTPLDRIPHHVAVTPASRRVPFFKTRLKILPSLTPE
jgi:hypothetical protein